LNSGEPICGGNVFYYVAKVPSELDIQFSMPSRTEVPPIGLRPFHVDVQSWYYASAAALSYAL
jgi:hypothetical protein